MVYLKKASITRHLKWIQKQENVSKIHTECEYKHPQPCASGGAIFDPHSKP